MPHILLVEPDKKLASVYVNLFESMDCTVSWAAHAQDAVSLADENRPDLVILELQLAGHNGIEFLYEFRSYVEWQNVPVVLLTYVTPRALNITAETMESLGIQRCLYKPSTTLGYLRRIVREQLAIAA
jgi:DNA-binding response OmpR family regulator